MNPSDPSAPSTTLVSSDIDGVKVVSVSGTVDAVTAPALRTEIKSALDDEPQALIIDLMAVDFLGSVGLEILVTTRQELDETVPVVVVADGPVTRRPIELTRVDEFVPLHTTLEAALHAVRRQ